MTMSDSHIATALECCAKPIQCGRCAYVCRDNCRHDLITDALDLVQRQQAEIDKLNIELQAMRGAANSYKAEVERLKNQQ